MVSKAKIYSTKSEDDSAAAIRSLILHQDEPIYMKKRTCVPTLLINGEHDPLIQDKLHFKLEAHFLNVTKKSLIILVTHHILKNQKYF